MELLEITSEEASCGCPLRSCCAKFKFIRYRLIFRSQKLQLYVFQVSVVYMSTRLFVNLSQVFIPLYLHETLNMTASALASVPLVMFIGSFVTSLVTEKVNRNFGRKLAYIFGSALGICGCVWIRFRSVPDFVQYEVYIVAAIIGCGGSIILVTSLGITADLIGDKTGNGAFVYGLMSFTDKLANGIAVIVIQDL